jgi:hypothetical protein
MAHVTFIHGIANKPPLDQLTALWCRSLADADGVDLGAEGVTCSMVYWADVLYAAPLEPGAAESATNEAAQETTAPEPTGLDVAAMPADERAWTLRLAAKLDVGLAAETAAGAVASPVHEALERVPLPWPIKRQLMKRLLRDVHHYLFDVEHTPRPGATYRVQDEIRQRVLRALQAGAARPGPHVVVSHSMGTVIAYDCLKRAPGHPAVDGLMTIGSPLGLDEIQDMLRPEWTREDGFPGERLRGGWVNVYDMLDPVAAFDPKLAGDYRRAKEAAVDDVNEQNSGTWRHDISKYLAGAQLRARLRALLGL